MIGALSGSGGYAAYGIGPASRLQKGDGQGGGKDSSQSNNAANTPPGQLTDEQQRIVDKLKQREAEVKAHEQAHKNAGGPYAGSPTYTTTQGPDGRRYITGGEVSIDISPEQGDPAATIRKMEQVKRAALAPTDPSGQDRAVAQQAEAIKVQAEAQLADQRREQLGVGGSTDLTASQGASSNESKVLPKGPYNQASKAYQAASSILGALQGVGIST